MSQVMRNQIADYLNTGSILAPVWSLMGVGFNTLGEVPAAQSKAVTYINDSAETSSIKSYKPAFPFDSELISDEAAIMKLYGIGRDEKTGSEAQVEYIRVELFRDGSATGIYKARKFTVSAEVSAIDGKGGENISVKGNLNNVGSFVDGEFNTATKQFTAYAGVLSAIELNVTAVSADTCKANIYPLVAPVNHHYVYKSAAGVSAPVYNADLTAGWTAVVNGEVLAGLSLGHTVMVALVLTAGNLCKGVSNGDGVAFTA